jgi:hypothetical protein
MSDQQTAATGVRCPACTSSLPQATSACPRCALVQPARLAVLMDRVNRTAAEAVTLRAEAQAYLQAVRTPPPAPAAAAPAAALRKTTDEVAMPAPPPAAMPLPTPQRPVPVRQAVNPPARDTKPAPAPARVAANTANTATSRPATTGCPASTTPAATAPPVHTASPVGSRLTAGGLHSQYRDASYAKRRSNPPFQLAAGVTFLAVNWNSLSLGLQATIMGTFAVAALAAAVPASRRKLNGTAEAFALLGFGLLVVNIYAARAKGLIPSDTTDDTTYAGIAGTGLALVCLLMHRLAKRVVTFGLATVLVAQVPVTLLLITRGDLAILLTALLAQAVATLLWTRAHGSRPVRVAGATCALLAYAAVTQIALVRIMLGLAPDPSVSLYAAVATGAVTVLAAAIGIHALRHNWLPFPTPAGVGECICAAVGALAVGGVLAQLPVGGAWFVTALATVLAITELLRSPRALAHQEAPVRAGGSVVSQVLVTAIVVLGGFDVIVLAGSADLRQLACLALITAALTVLANVRKRVDAAPMAMVAFSTPIMALLLLAIDGLLDAWAAGIACGVITAASICFAGWRVGKQEEGAALVPGAAAAVIGLVMVAVGTTGTDLATGVGLLLTIAAAPLLGYGRLPGRKAALLLAVPFLTAANIGFVLGARANTLELFTVPPALVMLVVGLMGWRGRSTWVSIAPGLLVGLLPSALIATRSEEPIRLAAVVAVAVAIILIGVSKSLQAPFVIGTVVLTKIGIWQFLSVAPLVPRWITLGLAGAILLAVGATYERRLAQARQAIHWISDLH